MLRYQTNRAKINLTALAAALIFGIVVGEKIGLSGWSVGIAVLLAAVCGLASFCQRRTELAALLVLFAVVGLLRSGWPAPPDSTLVNLTGERVEVRGWIAAGPVVYPGRTVCLFRVEGVARFGTGEGADRFAPAAGEPVEVVLYPPANSRDLHYGDALFIRGEISQPAAIRNPGDFNYRQYLARRGIHTRMLVSRPGDIQKVGKHPTNPFWETVYGIKEKAVGVFVTLPEQEQSLVRALLFGSREGIAPELRASFSRVGVVHILSVSALHVGLVMAFILGLTSILGLNRGCTFITVAAVLLGYAAMTGFSPSVQRAGLMGLIALGGYLFQQPRNYYNALALAALLILLVQPYALFEPGFQLSFVAAAGLLHLGPYLGRRLEPLPGARAMGIVLAAQLAVWPLTAYYFNLVSVVSVVSNLVIVGLATVLVNLGWMAVLIGLVFPPAAAPLVHSAGAVAHLLLAGVSLFDSWPCSAIGVPTPSLFLVGGYYLLLAAWRAGWIRRVLAAIRLRQAGKPAVAVILIVCVAIAGWGFVRPQRLVATFFDVGQGDCILFDVPGFGHCLIDTGGRPAALEGAGDFGDSVVVPALRRSGVRSLAMVVITHDHDDHAGGLQAILQSIPVSLLVVADCLPTAGGEQSRLERLMTMAQEKGTRVIKLERGDRLRLGAAEAVALHPPRKAAAAESDRNDDSLVLRLRYRQVSFLLTGDAGTGVLREIMNQDATLDSTVLKLPHHGSQDAFCPDFYEQVSPGVVVVSVGNNPFGHPAPAVTEYWETAGVPLYRTDRDGAVIISTDGHRIRVRSLINQGERH